MVVVVPCASPAVGECVCVGDGDAILVGLCVEAGEVWVHGQEYTGRVVVFLSKIFLGWGVMGILVRRMLLVRGRAIGCLLRVCRWGM